MDYISIFFLAVGLALDAFSVSVTRGLSLDLDIKHSIIIALFFGGFQAVMPLVGWFLGLQLEKLVSTLAPWVAFLLLAAVGIKMIYESFREEEEDLKSSFSWKELFLLAIATSIDAFAVGITFAFLNTSIIQPVIIIGVVTFLLSLLGVYLGKKIGHLFESKIEVLGGLILIGIGFRILIEHIFF